MAWQDELLPASWRGVPFGVDSAGITPGRATAVHAYPYRQGTPQTPAVWAEDVGDMPHPFEIVGFLVDQDPFAGYADIFVQRDAMVAACSAPGTGVLVHPSLGARNVVLVGGCQMVERKDMGGAVELRFSFVESAAGPVYPATTTSTAASVGTAAAAVGSASSASLGTNLLGAVQTGAAAAGQVLHTVSSFATAALSVVQNATRAVNAVTGLSGTVGRFAGGNRLALQPLTATAGSLIAASTAARTAVAAAGAAANGLAILL